MYQIIRSLILISHFLNLFNHINCDDRPKILEIAVPKQLEENDELRLSCDIQQTDNKFPISFDWFLNDKRLETTKNIIIKNREDESRLIIKSLSIEHIGTVKCIAKNDLNGNQDTQIVNLFFNAKPKWRNEPNNFKAPLSSKVNIVCDIVGSPKPTITWYYLDKQGSIMRKFDTNILNLNLNKTTIGRYKCKGSNSMGSLEKVISLSYYEFFDKWQAIRT